MSKKKMAIIGTGGDVIEKERGEFLNANFNEIVIMNQSIFKIHNYKKYLGDPTIWACCGWYNSDPIFDPTLEEQSQIHDIILKSKIHEVWYNTSTDPTTFNFTIPSHIKNISISGYRMNNYPYHSLGLQSILYALTLNYDLYYFGIDSYRKSYHFYEKENETQDIRKMAYELSGYSSENRIIKNLIAEGKLKHIDTLL